MEDERLSFRGTTSIRQAVTNPARSPPRPSSGPRCNGLTRAVLLWPSPIFGRFHFFSSNARRLQQRSLRGNSQRGQHSPVSFSGGAPHAYSFRRVKYSIVIIIGFHQIQVNWKFDQLTRLHKPSLTAGTMKRSIKSKIGSWSLICAVVTTIKSNSGETQIVCPSRPNAV